MRSGDIRPGMIFMFNMTSNDNFCTNDHHLVNIIFYVKLNQLSIDVEMLSLSIRDGHVDNVAQYCWANKDHNEESFEQWHRMA